MNCWNTRQPSTMPSKMISATLAATSCEYYHEDDSVRGKVVTAIPSVEVHGNKLCGCLTVELKEPLLDDEQTILCNYITGQYSDGWGEGFEQREIDVGDGKLYVHFLAGSRF